MIRVEIAYALPREHVLQEIQVAEGTTARQAVVQSGIDRQYPEIDPGEAALGIFSLPLDGRSRPGPDDYVLKEGDRVEVYRPLIMDPKQTRRKRAAGKRQ